MDNTTPGSGSGKKIAAIVIVVVAIVLIALGFYYSGKMKNTDEVANPETPAQENIEFVQTINTKHQYKNGMHTFAGEVELPSLCHLLESSAKQEGDKYVITFKSTIQGEACVQVVTPRPFKVTFSAPENATIEAFLDGMRVKLNLFEVKADENLDAFQIYLKG